MNTPPGDVLVYFVPPSGWRMQMVGRTAEDPRTEVCAAQVRSVWEGTPSAGQRFHSTSHGLSSAIRASPAGFVTRLAMRPLTLLLALTTDLGAQAPAAPAATPHLLNVRDYGAKPDDNSDSGPAFRSPNPGCYRFGTGR